MLQIRHEKTRERPSEACEFHHPNVAEYTSAAVEVVPSDEIQGTQRSNIQGKHKQFAIRGLDLMYASNRGLAQ